MRPAMEAQTPNHWTTREVPQGEDFEEREGTGWMTRSLGSACVYKAPSGVQQRSLLCGGRVGGELKTPKTRVEKWSGQSRMWVLLRREETRRSSGAGSGGGFHQVRGYNTLVFLEILLVPHGGCPRKEERRVEVGD